MGAVKGGVKKINMVLNIHYLCLSVGWEVPKGDFNCDEIVLCFFFVILSRCYTTATASLVLMHIFILVSGNIRVQVHLIVSMSRLLWTLVFVCLAVVWKSFCLQL